MGRRKGKDILLPKSHTLPSSPTHSSSSSDFEFTISLSPRKSSAATADELFYKGQLLPLHLSPRISMVRTLLLASSSTSSSSDTTTATSRDSSGSSNDSRSSFSADLLLHDCDSSRPSSVAEDDEYKRLNPYSLHHPSCTTTTTTPVKRPSKFSLSRFSSVFKKDPAKSSSSSSEPPATATSSSVKRISATAREVIRKYMKKVKPLYEKLSQNQKQKNINNNNLAAAASSVSVTTMVTSSSDNNVSKSSSNNNNNVSISHSFSGNLRYPRRRRRSIASSCPSSMRSSPSHSGVLSRNNGLSGAACSSSNSSKSYGDASSMEELQSAIQGAIAHCKNSLMQNNNNIHNHHHHHHHHHHHNNNNNNKGMIIMSNEI